MAKRKKSAVSNVYTGVLATPIVVLPLGGEFSGKDAQAAQQQIYDHQRESKFKALFEWYAIDPASPEAWKCLAKSLAFAHVPGMHIRAAPKKRGRRASWEDGLYVKLLREVHDLRDKNEGITVAKALRILRDQSPWKRYAPQLEARYTEARRIEKHYRSLYREWKGNPGGFKITLLKSFAIDPGQYFEQRRLEGFKIDEI